MTVEEKHHEAGFTNARNMEEGRVPATEKILSVSASTPQPASRTNTFSASIRGLAKSQSWKSVLPNTSKADAPCHVDKLEDFPLGYPRLACFMNSDISFSMYRRFGRLHARLLLHKQDQIRELEAELDRLDVVDDKVEETQLFLQCREEADYQPAPADGKSRQQILQELEKLLLEYGTLMEQALKLEAMEKPTKRDHTSVTNYFDREAPVVDSDREFLLNRDDLVTIRAGRDHAWLDAAVESVLRWYPCKPVKYMFCDRETRQKTDNEDIHYFTRSRVNFFVTFIITALILILLVVPIGVLFYLSINDTSGPGEFLIIGVLLLCTLVFSCVLSLFTKAKRHELLAASAG